ncbi:unnamed protein product [Diamesa tonsa]
MNPRALSQLLLKRSTFSSVNVRITGGLEAPLIGKAKPYTEIPGPKELPIIGNSWRFAPIIGQHKVENLDRVMLQLHEVYGKIVKVSGLKAHPDLLFLFDGDEIRKVFRLEERLPHRPAMPSLHNYKSSLQKDFFGETAGVIGVHGKKWDVFRAQVQQVMLSANAAKKYIGPLDEIADDFLTRIDEMLDEKKELPGNLLHELYKWALESVCRVALDTRLGCLSKHENPESKKIIDAINTFFWTVAEVELRLPVWRFYKTKSYLNYIAALDSFKDLCMKHITVAMDKLDLNQEVDPNNMSIVEKILRQTRNPKIAAVLALDLMLVGVDTTSVACTSIMYLLSKNPIQQEKLFKELQGVMKSKDTKVTEKTLENVPYLRACIKEALRMYPVVLGNGRSLQSDAVICGYTVPKGTHVIFPHYVLSNKENYFNEPTKFIPERWLKTEIAGSDSCPFTNSKIHPFVSLPFGYGRRTCLGRRFAEAELAILLSKIFRKYQIRYNYGEVNYKVSPTYIPDKPMRFQMIERKS